MTSTTDWSLTQESQPRVEALHCWCSHQLQIAGMPLPSLGVHWLLAISWLLPASLLVLLTWWYLLGQGPQQCLQGTRHWMQCVECLVVATVVA
jgi:hypothetical protein